MALMAAFSWDNSLRDVSGYNHPTAPIGTPSFVPGRFGKGLACFDGEGQTVTYPAGSYYFNLDGGKSFACWVKADPGPAGQSRVLYHLGSNKLFLANTAGFVAINVDGSQFSTSTNVCDGTWHHILYTWDRVTAPGTAMRLYIDGVQVATTTRSGIYNDSGVGHIGRSVDGEPANAVISDFRAWNDPVFANEVTMIRDTPVTSAELGAYSFNATAESQVFDASTYRRHLTTTGQASLVAGRVGTALTSTGAGAAVDSAFAPGPCDRVSLVFWARATSFPAAGSPRTLVSLRDASNVRVHLELRNGGTVVGTVRKDDGTVLTETAGATMALNTWTPIVLRAWAGAITVMVNGVMGDSGVLTIPPINTPSYSNIERALVGATGVQIDDLWVMRGFLSGEALTRLQARPVPAATPTGAMRGDGTILRPWLLTGSGLVELRPASSSLVDTDPPSVPAGLGATALGQSGFTLSWAASTDAGDVPDTAAPSVPIGLTPSGVSSSSFTLSWEESTDA